MSIETPVNSCESGLDLMLVDIELENKAGEPPL